MPGLSNLFRMRDAAAPVYRPVQRGEIEPALRLILGGHRGHAGDEQVLDFLAFSMQRGIDVNRIWVADVAGRIEWALLPTVSPGRTMLLMVPSRLPRRAAREIMVSLHERLAAHHFNNDGVLISQVLIDPADGDVIDALLGCQYELLAELAYLQADIRGNEAVPALPPGWVIQTYETSDPEIFATTLGATYEQSLDCPGLNNRRDMSDIIAGHKAAGDFDPRMWFLLLERDIPQGVLLLSRTAGNTSVELVYIGLTLPARGRGAGNLLLRWALAVTGLEGRQHLSLAVDSKNHPALRMYYRHGFARIGVRVAMIRDLRTAPPTIVGAAVSQPSVVNPS